MPKTQSALLEAMAERQVTVDGVTRRAARAVPRDRDREPDRAGGHLPAARGAARPVLPDHGLARLPERRRGGDDRREQRHGHPLADARAGRHRSTRCATLERAVEDVYIDELLLRWIVELVRGDARARARRDRRVRPGEPRARAHGAGLGAAARALVRRPEDVERCFLPVIGHRIVFTPTFLAEHRGLGPRSGARRDPRGRPRARAAARAGLDEREREPSRAATAPDVGAAVAATVPARPPPRGSSASAFGEHREHAPRRGARTSPARGRTCPATRCATIDWQASARLSAARAEDEFIVRERFARGDAARRGRLPTAARDGALRPPLAVALQARRAATPPTQAIVASAVARTGRRRLRSTMPAAARQATPSGCRPQVERDRWLIERRQAPETAIRRTRRHRRARARVPRPHALRRCPSGRFVFVLSDFLAPA